MFLLYLSLSVLAGVAVVIGRTVNSRLAMRIGTLQGTFINYIVGLGFSVLILLFLRESFTLSLPGAKMLPIWAYFGGAVGVAVVCLSNYVTPRISSFYSTLFLFIGQLFAGILLDYMILKELPLSKLAGGLLVLAGLVYNLLIDRKKESHEKESG